MGYDPLIKEECRQFASNKEQLLVIHMRIDHSAFHATATR